MNTANLQNAAWALSSVLECILLVQLISRHLARLYPFFSAYLLFTLVQSAAILLLYRAPGLSRDTVWNVAWGTQGIVLLCRSLAVVEVIKKVLSRYSGIWGLAWRLLTIVGMVVFAYSLLFSQGQSHRVILNGVRGVELALAAVVVAMLLFARYYRVPVSPLQFALIVGFCLYSAFFVINYSLLERVVQQYAVFWNFVGMLTFLACLLIWMAAAARSSEPAREFQPQSLSREAYSLISPQVNLSLQLLDRQLAQFLHSGDRRK